MELIERPDLTAVHYLNSISFETFKNDCLREAEDAGTKKPTMINIKTWYSILKQFCKTNIKTKGITKRIYSYSLNTPAGLGGRLFSGGSMQGIWSVYRGLLMRGIGTDIDMKNAHPVILRYVCKKHNIDCPMLEYYINNRDKCLSEFENKDIGKTMYLISTNNDKSSRKPNLPQNFRNYDKEMKEIQKKLVKLTEYKDLFETIPEYKESKNYNGCATNRVLCYYENIILQHVIHTVNTKGIEIAILMFDGLMIYGDYYKDDGLLKEITDYVNKMMPNLNMVWSYKEHDNTLNIPDDFEIDAEEEVVLKTFESVMQEFEKTHAKIANKGVFIKQLQNDNIIMSRQHIKTAYENMIYQKYDRDGNLKNHNFINDWLVNNPDQRCYDDVGVYPKDELCPSNHFNMWRKFAMEMVTEYEHHQAGLDMVLNHIKILCNHEEAVSDYFIKWIAQMIQYPEVKSICPVLISKEGAGKGTLLRLFEKMLGNDKIFQTTTPSRDIWGEFNSHMANSFLVNLDELSKKETSESEGKIKGLITEPKITINNKGVNKYDINSFHRFLITTNNEEPVNTTKDDRRKMIIRSSDEKIGDKEYFEDLYELLDDVNVVKTCFEYFKSIPDMDEFHKIKMPCTEYQNELKEISRSPIEKWLEDFTLENITEESVEMSKEEILGSFMAWCSTNKVEYHVDSLKLMVRLNRLNISGVVKRQTKTVNKTKFVIDDLKKHFMVGCLI